MNDLLGNAVAAHGGLDRWNQVKSITVDAPITEALWSLKSKVTRSRTFASRWAPRGSW
jgi:hypothetical protein